MAKSVLLCIISMEFISNNVYAEPFFRNDYTYIAEVDSFYKFSTTPDNWFNAKKLCAYEGAELWIPENEIEVKAVIALWDKNPRKFPPPRRHLGFVGITDLITEGHFVTTDGRSSEEIYANWAAGEPNNYNNDEDCIWMLSDGTINDLSCTGLSPYVCKKRQSTLDWNVLCDMPDLSYKYSSDMNKCYKLHKHPKNWDEAHTICKVEQSYLTIINSVKERDVIVKLIADGVKGNGIISGDFIHMGFHNKFEDNWITVKGASLDASGYAVWADNRPEQSADLKCGAIQPSGELRGVGCDKEALFICEHDIQKLGLSVDEKHG